MSGRHALSSEDVRYGAGAFSDGEAERSTRRRSGGGGVGGGSYYGSMQHYHHHHRPRRQSEALDWRSMASRQPHYVTLTRYTCFEMNLLPNSESFLVVSYKKY